MRRSGWTPSIVPSANDQNVYMVMEISGALAASGRKPTSKAPTSRHVRKVPRQPTKRLSLYVTSEQTTRSSHLASSAITNEMFAKEPNDARVGRLCGELRLARIPPIGYTFLDDRRASRPLHGVAMSKTGCPRHSISFQSGP
jgi:hypothetical protein